MPSSITSSNEEASLLKQTSQESNSSESDTIQQSKSSEEYVTPCSTLKNLNYDDFKRQMQKEYINNANELQTSNADTLKLNQPIDPSRINDSLKLYSENIMSKSFSVAEQCLRSHPGSGSIDPYRINDTFSRCKNYALQKSGSAISKVYSEDDSWLDKGINRSKSGPNWYLNGDQMNSDDTLKPSTIKRNQQEKINIEMDCYDDLQSPTSMNTSTNVISSSSANGTTEDSADTETLRAEYESAHLYHDSEQNENGVVLRRPKGSTAIKRRSGNKRLVLGIYFLINIDH